ncbi:hypothetical protein CULT_2450003 [[Clostridium] ultunense Esp]|nr:hypothetical protein CULT_2450003 [[Clostridium] ultunense Esp]
MVRVVVEDYLMKAVKIVGGSYLTLTYIFSQLLLLLSPKRRRATHRICSTL